MRLAFMPSLCGCGIITVRPRMAGAGAQAYFGAMIDWLGARAPITLIFLATLALGLVVTLVSTAV
ncbi:hypothetical protein [Glacieibacterium frigidum]|uniref:Uncharacterized protein n=1 Tax=Glacieibacterium frigidum TaxID=2593303 RepID=A0A552U9S4_9SPHN|nr:hypothetical protein [Glacieibacterium frigidum]TRW14974.1 hypothetical protein FMM06_15050 [Glacieibacterium frigidum]